MQIWLPRLDRLLNSATVADSVPLSRQAAERVSTAPYDPDEEHLTMINRDHLNAVIHELLILAEQAQQLGNCCRQSGLPAEYWYGVQYGYEDAAERIRDLITEANEA